MSVGLKNLESPQIKSAVLAITKTGVGTPVLSGLCANFCHVLDTGVGIYTIIVNYPRPFAQLIVGSGTLHASTPGILTIDKALSTKLQVVVKTFNVDGTTAADKDFDLVLVGSYALDLNS